MSNVGLWIYYFPDYCQISGLLLELHRLALRILMSSGKRVCLHKPFLWNVFEMPIPAHMWLKDDGGAHVKGSSTVQDHEGSIEIISFGHGVNLPVDPANGKITGARSPSPLSFEKGFDAATPYLYKAVTKGQTLESAEIKWYRINDAGREEVYFVMLLEGVKVCGINPGMANNRLAQTSALNHVEAISMMYERITWHYLDGNIKYTDAWNER